MFADPDELDELETTQCPCGVVVGVEGSSQFTNKSRNVTDLLVYGVLSPGVQSVRGLTPTSASLDESVHLESRQGGYSWKELRLYAAPLCSTLISKADALPSPPPSPSSESGSRTDHKLTCEFLPDIQSPSPKRKRMANLFDAATEFHKRVRRRGGVMVSQFLSRENSSSSQITQPSQIRVKKEVDSPDSVTPREKENVQESGTRSISRAGVAKPNPALPSHMRAASFGRPHTSSISSRRSTPAPPTPTMMQSEAPSSPSEAIAANNKALLTRTILTCMRLYGYHRNSRTMATYTPTLPSRRQSVMDHDPGTPVLSPALDSQNANPPEQVTNNELLSADQKEENEFKAMYHATYRASTFALRRYLKVLAPSNQRSTAAAASAEGPLPEAVTSVVPILDKEKTMNLVDSLLKLFCEETTS